MALLLLYAVGSAAWSNTLTSHGPLFALLDRLGVVPFLLYLIAPAAFPTERERRILVGGLTLLGAYLGLTTLFEAVGAKGLVVPHYIRIPNLGIHAGRGPRAVLGGGRQRTRDVRLPGGGRDRTLLVARPARPRRRGRGDRSSAPPGCSTR